MGCGVPKRSQFFSQGRLGAARGDSHASRQECTGSLNTQSARIRSTLNTQSAWVCSICHLPRVRILPPDRSHSSAACQEAACCPPTGSSTVAPGRRQNPAAGQNCAWFACGLHAGCVCGCWLWSRSHRGKSIVLLSPPRNIGKY